MPVEVCGGVLATGCSRGIGTCLSSSSNRSAIAEASLEEIIKSGEKVAKTSGAITGNLGSTG